MITEHYKVRIGRNTEQMILQLIQDNSPQGINTGQLLAKTGLSMPVLSSHIKKLEKEEKIEHFEKEENRKQRWYRVKPNSVQIVKAQLGRFEASRFIDSLINPFYIVESKGNYTVSLFAQWDNVQDRVKTEEQLRELVSGLAKGFEIYPKYGKFALVVTSIKEDVSA